VKKNVWIKSTRTGSNGQCVEVRDRGVVVDVRDSKNPSGPTLTFTPGEWSAFVEGVKDGEFDQN
jgi:hypothetical protein